MKTISVDPKINCNIPKYDNKIQCIEARLAEIEIRKCNYHDELMSKMTQLESKLNELNEKQDTIANKNSKSADIYKKSGDEVTQKKFAAIDASIASIAEDEMTCYTLIGIHESNIEHLQRQINALNEKLESCEALCEVNIQRSTEIERQIYEIENKKQNVSNVMKMLTCAQSFVKMMYSTK